MSAKPYYHLCKMLTGDMAQPVWSPDIALVPFQPMRPDVVTVLHDLLSASYAVAGDPLQPVDDWWQALSSDPEYEAALVFPVLNKQGDLIAFVHCWSRAFIKDIVVHPDWRSQGIGEALLLHCFHVFYGRGAEKICLKVERHNPFGAERFYRRLGMTDMCADT